MSKKKCLYYAHCIKIGNEIFKKSNLTIETYLSNLKEDKYFLNNYYYLIWDLQDCFQLSSQKNYLPLSKNYPLDYQSVNKVQLKILKVNL
jgi:hypothetical protein